MKHQTWIALLLMTVGSALSSEVVMLDWETHHASPPPVFESEADNLLPAFRAALLFTPEAGIVNLALSQPALLGLTKAQATTLQPLAARRYEAMASSPTYAKAASMLPYCYGETRPTRGKASLYVPDHPSPTTPMIVFLHGYGGSFLWYQHWLSEIFPGHIILCPAYGVSSGLIPSRYVAEAIAATSVRLGFSPEKPSLIGLSAGGFGACRVYVENPTLYSRLICLAAFPPPETLKRFPKNSVTRFLSGAAEPFVISKQLAASVQHIHTLAPETELQTIPQAGHFFMLTHPGETAVILQRWMSEKSSR